MERAPMSGGMGELSGPVGSTPETKSTATQTQIESTASAPSHNSTKWLEVTPLDESTMAVETSSTKTASKPTVSSPPSLTIDTSGTLSASTNGSMSLAQVVTADAFYPGVPYTPSVLPQNARSASPSSTRRRPSSQSPDRGADNARILRGVQSNGIWTRGGKSSSNSFRRPSFSSSGLPSKPQASLPPDFEPHQYNYADRKANPPPPSMSVPSTPQFGKKVTRTVRTPSPAKGVATSPQSAMSEPVKPSRSGVELSGCMFETALSDSRRRMPYSLGTDRLLKENGVREKLTAEEEDKLTKQIEALVEQMQPTPEILDSRGRFVVKLEDIFNKTWPGHDIKVRTFGSTVNRLSSKDSDVDVCVTTQWDGLLPVCKVARALDKAGMKRVVCVSAAKVPIVKIQDPEFDVACDMNINNIGALENTRMIKTYVDIDPRVRPLAMVIKYWTKRRIINDAAGGGTLSSYTWTCMILNFLQTRDPPILPSLHRPGIQPHTTEDGAVITFDDDIESLRGFGAKNKETLGGLLYAFFKKYGHDYDYDQSVISVRDGIIKPKEGTPWHFIQNNRLCIEEPFNTTRNLGNTADDTSIKGLHLELRRACRILAEGVDLDKCCEQYVFPPEKTFSIPAAPASHSHGVRISAVPSSRGRGGGGYGARGRSYGGAYGRQGFRRQSNGSQFYTQQQQQQLYDSNNYYYPSPTPEQFYSAIIQQQQLQLFQQTQAAHARVQAQLQAQQSQMSSSDRGATTPGSEHMPSNNSNVQQMPSLFPYAYSQMFGLPPFFYAPYIQQDNSQASSSVPASPPITPNVPEMRNGVGRGRRSFNASRSRSQPPTNGYQQSMSSVYGRQPNMNPSDDEYDYGDLSSNGSVNQHVLHRSSQPETPPDDEISDEYAGFIIGGVFQPEIATEQLHVPTEPFGSQKSYADRQKRISNERLPSPLLDRRKMSLPPSPLQIERDLVRRASPSPLNSAMRDGFEDSLQGSRASILSSYRDAAIGSPSSQSSLAGEEQQRLSYMHEHSLPYGIHRHINMMQTNELRNVRSSPALTGYTSHPGLTTHLSPLGDATKHLRHFSEEQMANAQRSPQQSRRNPPTKSNSDMRKMKSRNGSQEDLSSHLSAIPESGSRKGSTQHNHNSSSPTKSHGNHHGHHGHHGHHHHNHSNGSHAKERSAEHQPPPTPASNSSESQPHPQHSRNSNNHSNHSSGRSKKHAPHPLQSSTTGSVDGDGKKNSTPSRKGGYSKVTTKKKKKSVTNSSVNGEEKRGG